MRTAESQPTSYDELTKTASFVLVFRQIVWLKEEAKRRNLNQSELMRDLIDAAMSEKSGQEKVA